MPLLLQVDGKVICEGSVNPLRCPACRHIFFPKSKSNAKKLRCPSCQINEERVAFYERFTEICKARVIVPVS